MKLLNCVGGVLDGRPMHGRPEFAEVVAVPDDILTRGPIDYSQGHLPCHARGQVYRLHKLGCDKAGPVYAYALGDTPTKLVIETLRQRV